MGAEVFPLPKAVDVSLIDRGVIEDLRDMVGDRVCREILVDAVLEITERLAKLEAALEQHDGAAIGKLAHDLVSMPGQIGMTCLSRVSANLADVANRGDWVSVQAVARRLLRVGEETLAQYPVGRR